jgi:hypothetical protein
MSEDFLIRHFPEAGQAQWFLALVVLIVVALGVRLGRKHLKVAIPIALIFLLLSAIAIASAIPARPYAQRNACIYNLKTIQETKARWASEHGKLTSDVPTEADLFGEGKYIKHDLQCPRGGAYRIGSVAENPTCSHADLGHHLGNAPKD